MRIRLTILVILLYSTFAFAQFETANYYINENNLPYQILFPENYDQMKKYPLVVFLHGVGERGIDNQKQLTHGREFFLEYFQSRYPAIVIIPQCPEVSYWANIEIHTLGNNSTFAFGVSEKPTVPMETLMALVTNWLKSGKVDTSQVYVGGLSMGGMGTYELLQRMPDTFAAAFSICGGGDINKVVDNTKNIAVWIFHGEKDFVVPVKFSRDMYNSLKEAGNEVKYTEYPDVNHNSWKDAFQEKELVPWLFSHKR